MPMVQEFWKKLNANEKLVGYGIVIVLISWLVGIVTGGGFGSSWAFVAAIAVAIIYWLKYAPNQSITWPAPIQTIVLVISGIAALLSILGLLTLLGLLSFLGILYLLAVLLNAVGAGIMAYGAWKEYQAMPKTASAAPSAPISTPMSTPMSTPSTPMSTPPPPPPAPTTPPDSTPPSAPPAP